MKPFKGDACALDLARIEVATAKANLAAARETIKTLNRRAQLAEGVADQNVEACRRAGVSLGRSLARYAAEKAKADIAAERKRQEEAEAALKTKILSKDFLNVQAVCAFEAGQADAAAELAEARKQRDAAIAEAAESVAILRGARLAISDLEKWCETPHPRDVMRFSHCMTLLRGVATRIDEGTPAEPGRAAP